MGRLRMGREMNRVLHQVWIQGESEIPDSFRSNRQKWADSLPNFEMKLWDEKSAREQWPDVDEHFDKCFHHATRADLILARALRDFGGLATGTDCVPNRPDLLLRYITAVDSMLVITPGRAEISNGLQWSANPHHPFWDCVCKHQLREGGRHLSNKNVPWATGPGCYMAAFRARKWNLFLVTAPVAFTRDWNKGWSNKDAFIDPGFSASWWQAGRSSDA